MQDKGALVEHATVCLHACVCVWVCEACMSVYDCMICFYAAALGQRIKSNVNVVG